MNDKQTPIDPADEGPRNALQIVERIDEGALAAELEANVSFETSHADAEGKPLRVPGGFVIGVPVFKQESLFRIQARLRYRVQGTSIVWWFALYKADVAFQTAIREACERAREATGLPLFYGTAEVP